jgi:hypothetical protein
MARSGNGKINFVQGKAYILQYTRGYKKIAAKVNQLVTPQDIIMTEAKAIVKVRLADGSSIHVRGNSRVKFAFVSKRSQQINVGKGGVLSQVSKLQSRKSFQVTTPTAVAGVRGTKFIVEHDEKSEDSSVDVYEGKVALSSYEGNKRSSSNLEGGNALYLSKSQSRSFKRSADPNILRKYESAVDEAATLISGWEFN